MELNDTKAKLKSKHYADTRNKAIPCSVEVVDSVILKHDLKQNKFSSPYNPKPHSVVARKVSMITACSGDKQITRNSSCFKGIYYQSTFITDSEEEEELMSKMPGRQDRISPERPSPPDKPPGDTRQDLAQPTR